MAVRVGVVTFPGSNCELDVMEAVTGLGGEAELLWHGDATVRDVDAVVVPGGFAHGDYLRPGAIARFSPVMDAVRAFAEAGGAVVGICNGFQVLTEAHLLPGALQKNAALAFQRYLLSEAEQQDALGLVEGGDDALQRLEVQAGNCLLDRQHFQRGHLGRHLFKRVGARDLGPERHA